jgi:hypothetical protein
LPILLSAVWRVPCLANSTSLRQGFGSREVPEQWLLGQRFDPALRATYAHYRAMLSAREAELAAVEADLTHWYTHGPFTDAVARLAAYRVAYVGALTIASEVGDWRRFPAARTCSLTSSRPSTRLTTGCGPSASEATPCSR